MGTTVSVSVETVRMVECVMQQMGTVPTGVLVVGWNLFVIQVGFNAYNFTQCTKSTFCSQNKHRQLSLNHQTYTIWEQRNV